MMSITSPKGMVKVRVPTAQGLTNGNQVVLLDGNGDEIQGQKDMVINAPVNGVITATVTFIVGGFVTEDEE